MSDNRPVPEMNNSPIEHGGLETMSSREQLLGTFVVFLLLLLAVLLIYL